MIEEFGFLPSKANTVSSSYSVESNLKQKHALSPILFNIALEKLARVLLRNDESALRIQCRHNKK
jgi:hypothetical protein